MQTPSSHVLSRPGIDPRVGAPAVIARALRDPRLVRGAGCAAVMVVVRVLLGTVLDVWPQHGAWLRVGGAVAVVTTGMAWGASDGRHADRIPDTDPTMRWLAASVFAGVAAGVGALSLAWGGVAVYGIGSALFELTAGSAWTLLLVFVAAVAGMRGTAGRR